MRTDIADYFVLTCFAIIATLMSCGHSSHDVKVKGGTDNKVTVDDTFCDDEAYPTPIERRACKDRLLAAIDCRKQPAP